MWTIRAPGRQRSSSRKVVLQSLFVWILWASIAASASAPPWQRHIQLGKGESFDTPEPHPLGYFTDDPFLRDDGGRFCSDCTLQGMTTVHLEEAAQSILPSGFGVWKGGGLDMAAQRYYLPVWKKGDAN